MLRHGLLPDQVHTEAPVVPLVASRGGGGLWGRTDDEGSGPHARPVVIVLALLAVHRRGWSLRVVLSQLLVPAVLSAGIGGWWWIRNYLLLGVVQPSRLGERVASDAPSDAYDPVRFAAQAISRLNATFWGRGASEAKAFPDAVESVLGIALLIVLVSAFVVGRRRLMLALLLTYPVLVLGTLLANSHSIFWDLGVINRGIQGRYVFSGAFAFGAAFALVASVLYRRTLRHRRLLAASAAWAPAIANVLAAIWLVPRSWSAAARAVDGRIPDISMGVPLAVYAVLVLALLVTTAALSLTMSRLAGRGSARESLGTAD